MQRNGHFYFKIPAGPSTIAHQQPTVRKGVLGLTLCDTVKWKENTNEIITKASKRLHILRVSKRAGVFSMDLICVYNASVRSVLEYSYVIWATRLPRYLVDQIERIQKRAMRILLPGLK